MGNCNGFNVCLAIERLPVLGINAIMLDKSQSWVGKCFVQPWGVNGSTSFRRVSSFVGSIRSGRPVRAVQYRLARYRAGGLGLGDDEPTADGSLSPEGGTDSADRPAPATGNSAALFPD